VGAREWAGTRKRRAQEVPRVWFEEKPSHSICLGTVHWLERPVCDPSLGTGTGSERVRARGRVTVRREKVREPVRKLVRTKRATVGDDHSRSIIHSY
jgi:hypothetical protein